MSCIAVKLNVNALIRKMFPELKAHERRLAIRRAHELMDFEPNLTTWEIMSIVKDEGMLWML